MQLRAGATSESAPAVTTTQDLDFFTSWGCPYAQRVWITLNHLGLDFNPIEISPADKPEWYEKEINPKVRGGWGWGCGWGWDWR